MSEVQQVKSEIFPRIDPRTGKELFGELVPVYRFLYLDGGDPADEPWAPRLCVRCL